MYYHIVVVFAKTNQRIRKQQTAKIHLKKERKKKYSVRETFPSSPSAQAYNPSTQEADSGTLALKLEAILDYMVNITSLGVPHSKTVS